MKNHRNDDYGTRKAEYKTPKHENPKKQNKSGEKGEKATEEESQASFPHKSKLREGTCYCFEKLGHILPDFPEEASTPKEKWAFRTATQNLCAESQKAESQYGNKKPQSTKDEEDNMSAASSWTTGTNFFIQAQSLLTNVLSNNVGDLYSKENEEQDSMAEEYLKNNIILASGSSIDILAIPSTS